MRVLEQMKIWCNIQLIIYPFFSQDEGLSIEEIDEEEILHEELLDVVDAAQFEQTLQGAQVLRVMRVRQKDIQTDVVDAAQSEQTLQGAQVQIDRQAYIQTDRT